MIETPENARPVLADQVALKLRKLEVVKQETARVNVDILGIRKLKWTGMGEFNSDDHYIYYCGSLMAALSGKSSGIVTCGVHQTNSLAKPS